MAAGPIGPCWQAHSWGDATWQDGSWGLSLVVPRAAVYVGPLLPKRPTRRRPSTITASGDLALAAFQLQGAGRIDLLAMNASSLTVLDVDLALESTADVGLLEMCGSPLEWRVYRSLDLFGIGRIEDKPCD